MTSKIPQALAAGLAALVLLLGAGAAYVSEEDAQVQALRNDPYIVAVVSDAELSDAVKIAMVMGYYYESSYRHIGTPYVDKLGKGRPLTVCNGITGAGVIAGRYYTPADCMALEKLRYLQSEQAAKRLLRYWSSYGPFVQAVFIDFLHNKGEPAFTGSTMRAQANGGMLRAACAQNPRWNKGTVNGVQVVLPGLQIRGDANAEICTDWRMPT